MRRAAADMVAACEGFADFVAAVEQQHAQQAVQQGDGAAVAEGGDGGGGGARLGARLLAAVRGLEAMEWMVPPMLQPR